MPVVPSGLVLRANEHTAKLIRCVPFLKEFHFSYTYNNLKCQGMQDFMDDYFFTIKENNPHVVMRIHRTYTKVDPYIFAIYEWQRQRHYRCPYKSSNQILCMVEQFAQGGSFFERKKGRYGVRTFTPRKLMLHKMEHRGHNPFKVLSKTTSEPHELNPVPDEKPEDLFNEWPIENPTYGINPYWDPAKKKKKGLW